MDYVEINKFTQDKRIAESRNKLYARKLDKVDALRLIVYACKKMYGINHTAKIIKALGVEKIDLSV